MFKSIGRILSTITVIALISQFSVLSVLGAEPSTTVGLEVDGEIIQSAVPPQLMKGTTMLPLRAMSTAQGAEVSFDNTSKVIFITIDGHVVKLQVDSNQAEIDGQPVTLSVPATVIDGNTLVPLRFISEALDSDVQWDAVNKKAIVNSASNLVQLTDVEGGVEVNVDGVWRPAVANERILEGSGIRTNEGSEVTLVTNDGSAIKMEPLSETKINELNRDKNTGNINVAFELIEGSLFSQVTQKGEGSEFKISSHGTDFIAPDSTFKLMASNGAAEVSVVSGNVVMNNPKLDKPMIVPTNTYIEGISSDFQPKDPLFITDGKLQDWDKQKDWMKDQMIRVQDDLVLKQQSLINFANQVPENQGDAQKAIMAQLQNLQDRSTSQQLKAREITPRFNVEMPQQQNEDLMNVQSSLYDFFKNKPANFVEISDTQKKDMLTKQVLFVDQLMENHKLNNNSDFDKQAEQLQGNIMQYGDIQISDIQKNSQLPNNKNFEFKPIEIPPGTILPPGFVLAPGTKIKDGMKLPDNVVLPAGANIPNGFQLPNGTSMPHDVILPNNFVFPDNVVFKPGFEFKVNSQLPDGAQLPLGFVLPEGAKLPKDVKLPPFFNVPVGTNLPDGVHLPPLVNLPEGVQIPNGAFVPDGTVLPKNVQLGTNVNFGEFVQFDSNFKPGDKGFVVPPDMEFKDGMLLPKDFKGKVETDSSGNKIIIGEDGTSMNINEVGIPKLPPGFNSNNPPPIGPPNPNGQSLKPPLDPKTGQPLKPPLDPKTGQPLNPQLDPKTGQPLNPQLDPKTGQPLNPQLDPNAGQPLNPQLDPKTGQPLNPQLDPNAGQPLNPQLDPNAGQPLNPQLDPNAGQPLNPSLEPAK